MICPQATQLLHQIFPVAMSYEVVILVFVAAFFGYIVYQEVVNTLGQRHPVPNQESLLDNFVEYQPEKYPLDAPILAIAQVKRDINHPKFDSVREVLSNLG